MFGSARVDRPSDAADESPKAEKALAIRAIGNLIARNSAVRLPAVFQLQLRRCCCEHR